MNNKVALALQAILGCGVRGSFGFGGGMESKPDRNLKDESDLFRNVTFYLCKR